MVCVTTVQKTSTGDWINKGEKKKDYIEKYDLQFNITNMHVQHNLTLKFEGYRFLCEGMRHYNHTGKQ